jgi:hypothetical protein
MKLILPLPVMKAPVNIVSRIIFLMAVLFCFEVNVYSGHYIQSTAFEISTGENSIENSFSSDLDSWDDDHINNFTRPGLFIDLISQTLVLQNYFLIPYCSVSVWHPPKIS